MMVEKFVPPVFQRDGYNCPHCGMYAHQIWLNLFATVHNSPSTGEAVAEAKATMCSACRRASYWVKGQLVYPEASTAPMPNEDLNEDVKNDFLEARTIVQKSPRGAAALLRLCIQKLCIQLGLPGKNLDDDIGELVKRGLSVTIQQSLDIVRVTGNNAVHPGEIDISDNLDVALKLFDLVNLIAQTMITEPNRIKALYESLPKGAKEAIAKRDAGGKK